MMPPIDTQKELVAYANILDDMTKKGLRPIGIAYIKLDDSTNISGVGFYSSQESAGMPMEFFASVYEDISKAIDIDAIQVVSTIQPVTNPFNTDN